MHRIAGYFHWSAILLEKIRKKLFSFFNLNTIIDAVVLLFIAIFILSYFEPSLLFLKTTINGGDTGSHYPSAAYLKEVLLPQGKIMGWDQGNYAGYPLFYHYFPLPFILMSFISVIWPLEISFKLISVLGTFLLPICVYFAFRAMKFNFPVPIIVATFTLPFLFNSGNSMWGANIPSTLAGEFCYSLGFAFVFLFIGTLYYGVKEKRFLILNSFLVFLIGMSHAYTLIFCFIIGSFFFFSDIKKNFKYLFFVYLFGFLLLAFWLLPVLGNTAYTTSFVFRWTIGSIFEILPVILIPFMLLSIVAFFATIKDERTTYIIYLALACVFVYLAGPRIGILDIRFVPFFQMLLTMYGAIVFTTLFKNNIKMPFLLPIIIFLLTMFVITLSPSFIHSWVNWNYSGYEQKKTWNVFHGIIEYLKNSGNSRVEWEHTPLDEGLGSIRTYETLPYFAKRQTLEGIHMLGAISAPFIFYIESETSYQACNPIPDYYYSTFDLKEGIRHFKMFNVSHFVVRSEQVKEAIKQYPEFKLEKKFGDYNIYRLLSNNEQYVEPLTNEPILYVTNKWRDPSYRWFSSKNLQDTFYAFKASADEKDRLLFKQIITDFSQSKPSSLSSKAITVTSTLSNESIDIETSKIGHPLLIKVSYHPNWKVTGADRIYLVSPSFMLIFPTSNKVHLEFTSGALGQIGFILSILGVIFIVFSPLWFKTTKEQPKETLMGNNRKWILLTVSAIGTVAVFFAISSIHPDTSSILVKGRQAFDSGNYKLAKSKFKLVIDNATLSSGLRNDAFALYATCVVRENNFPLAVKLLQQFISEYPNSFWTPQAYFDLAYCKKNIGDTKDAIEIYKKIIRDFPTTSWANYSKDRLKELNIK